MKKAFLVLGPESSGTRMVTRLLVEAGCHGDHGHNQRFDQELPTDLTPIVWRRSVPHFMERQWPDVRAMAGALRERGYFVRAIVTNRDWFPMLESQVKKKHVKSGEEAWANLQRAYPHIFTALERDKVPFVVVSYEAIVQRPRAAVQKLLEMIDLVKPKEVLDIQDENSKYYEGERRRKEPE